METRIRPDLKKPFRGLTTIQLFDKDTGKLVLEQHDENTYNDRLQFINYLDTVLKCKTPAMQSTVEPFTVLPVDSVWGSDAFTFLNCLYGTALGNVSSGYDKYARQLFATLWLTNNTTAETAHGYPNGIPVGLCDTAGINSKLAAYSCVGTINASESYVGNDRLHLVFDFGTDKCNVQFDSLWLYPSVLRRATSEDDYSYNTAAFYQARSIAEKELTTQFISTYPYFTFTHRINGDYSVLGYRPDSSGSSRNPYAIQVYNNRTGETVATYDKGSKISKAQMPFYYDAGTDSLYFIRYQSSSYASYILESKYGNDGCSVEKLDMSSGAITTIGTLYDLLKARWADYNIIANDGTTHCSFTCAFRKDNSVYLIFRLYGTSTYDGSHLNYYTIYSFDALTESFTKVNTVETFSNTGYTSDMCLVDDTVFIKHKVKSDQEDGYAYSAFDLLTGTIKSTSVISASYNALCDKTLSSCYSNGASATVTLLYDMLSYRRDICSPSNTDSVTGNKMVKRSYFTAAWSTHNKLTSPIKKTNMTTMKIQYDIIWDSISDVILPALM